MFILKVIFNNFFFIKKTLKSIIYKIEKCSVNIVNIIIEVMVKLKNLG